MIMSRKMRWAGHVSWMGEGWRGEECMEEIGGKVRRKETSRETKMLGDISKMDLRYIWVVFAV
jgi:hypothetical protein